MRRALLPALLLALAAVAALLLLRREEAPAPPYVAETADGLEAVTAGARWLVRTACVRDGGRTAGPGYVSRLVADDGLVLVDDLREPGPLNDTDFGGLGAFGWHHARGGAGGLRFSGENAWEVSGRACAGENGGFGVSAARVVRPPEARGEAVAFAVEVELADAWTFPEPLARVRYAYVVHRDRLEVRVDVTQLCGNGRCGRTGETAFVKEPKLVAHLKGDGPLPFTRMATLDAAGAVVCEFRSGGPPTGPVLHTGQCDHPQRDTLRFDRDGECPCLDVAMRAPDGPWQGGAGFDRWAVLSHERPRAFHEDTPSLDGVVWPCHGGSPADLRQRRWEVTGRQDEEGRYLSLGGLFPAWEGGRGGYDCEPLSRAFGPHGETFSALAEYRLRP